MDIQIQTMRPTHLVICIWSPYCVRIVRFNYTDVCGVVIRRTKSGGWTDINIIMTYIIIQWEMYIHVSPIINHASFAMNDLQNIILFVPIVRKRCMMNVNIHLIDETIVTVAPHVEKKPVYTINSMYESGSAAKNPYVDFLHLSYFKRRF